MVYYFNLDIARMKSTRNIAFVTNFCIARLRHGKRASTRYFLPFQLVKKHGDPLVNQPYTYFKFIIFYVRVGSY